MMKIILLLVVVLAIAAAEQVKSRPVEVQEFVKTARNDVPTDEELEQNANAKYEFSSNIEDHINDLSQHRSEVRDGLAVTGSYSYSDGYFKRTVNYVADENGYRVLGEEVVPLDGPHVDLDGTASVDSSAHGTKLRYTVQSVAADGPSSSVREVVQE